MARTEKEIEQLYENLRKTAGTDKSLNRINGTVVFMLKGMYAASAMPPRVDGFRPYCDALTDLYTMDASRANNKEKIIKALTTLDGFEDFLKQIPEGGKKTNYQLLVEKGGRMGAGKDKFDRMVAQLNDAVGLAIDLPVLQTEAPVRKEAEPEKAPGNGRKNGSAAQPEAQQPVREQEVDPSRSAARWIEDWKRQAAAESKKEDYPAAYYAKIMAARMLANSKRGKAKRLKETQLTEEQIEAKAKELAENELFGRFIQSLRDNGQKRAKAEAAVGAGHCGGLDDMFKEFLLKLPAGELKNEKLLNRYMPTAKDRIEELQQQVELKRKKNINACQKEAAEITVLRNLAHAERYTKSSLAKKIPTKPESTLDGQTKTLAESSLFTDTLGALGDREMRNLVREGHGGALVDELRLRNKASLETSPEVTELLNENTVGGRLKTIRRDAEELNERLEEAEFAYDDDSPEVAELMQESKGLFAEYLALDMLSRDPVSKKIDAGLLEKNVPWSKLKSVKENPEKNPVVRALTRDLSFDDVCRSLEYMSKATHEEFISNVQETYHPTKPAKEQPQEEQEIFQKVEEALKTKDEEGPIQRSSSFDESQRIQLPNV